MSTITLTLTEEEALLLEQLYVDRLGGPIGKEDRELADRIAHKLAAVTEPILLALEDAEGGAP